MARAPTKTAKDSGPLKLGTYRGVGGLVAFAPDGRTFPTRVEGGKLRPVDVGEAWEWRDGVDAQS